MLNSIETKEKSKFIANVKAFAIFFIALIILDAILIITTKAISDANYIFLIISNIAVAGIFQFLFVRFGKKGLLAVEIIVFLITIFIITEIILYNIYGVFMPLSSIINSAHSITENYSNELLEVIANNTTFIVRFIIFYAAFIVTSDEYLIRKKQLDIFEQCDKREKRINVAILILSIIIFIVSFLMIDKSSDFSYNVKKYGVKVSLVQSFFKTNNSLSIEPSKENENLENDNKNNNEFLENYNVLDIDYTNLDESGIDERGKNVNKYVARRKPGNKNEYTGIFKGKNLILICAEAYSHYVINEKLTPTLYRLTNNGFKFTDFYVPSWGGSTISGEFAFLNGIIPNDAANSMKKTAGKNMCWTMPRVLKREGYSTGAYHNGSYKYYDRNLTHRQNLGFDYYIANGNGLEEIAGAWATDEMMLEKTFESYHSSEPFCMYYMTISGHAFYNDSSNYKVLKHIEKVKEVYGDKYPEQVNNYICYQLYLEDALSKLVECLDKYDMTDNTVICMVSDHYPYGLNSAAFTSGIDYIPYLYEKEEIDGFEIDKNMPILWCGSLEKDQKNLVKTIDTPTSTIDLLPTLLNLFGSEYDSRLIAGRDVFSDIEPFVVYNSGSFITKDGRYSKLTNIFTPNENVTIDKDYVAEYSEKARNLILFSAYIVEENYYNYVFTNKNVTDELKQNMKSYDIDVLVSLDSYNYENYVEYFKKCNEDYIKNKQNKKENVENDKKIVYLTFDDGPNKYNNKILEILKNNNVKATFFVVGTNKEIGLKKIREEGHAIGLHSASHNYAFIYKSIENYLRDLYELQDAVYQATGEYVHIVRFPGGSKNRVSDEISYGIMGKLRDLVEELGFEYYDWQVATGDSSRDISKEHILYSVEQYLKTGKNEVIILMHDIHSVTVEALDYVIELCKRYGYGFDKINDDTTAFHALGVN